MKYLIILISSILFAFEGITIYNIPLLNTFETNETNLTEFSLPIKTIKPKLDLAVIIDKQLFKKYLPSIINSINSYLLYKDIDYNLTIYDTNETLNALKHKNIIVYTYKPQDVYLFLNYNNNFYFPMINKNDIQIDNKNFFFGGIDFTQQIKKLSQIIDSNKIIAINDNTIMSEYLFSIELSFFNTIPFDFKNIKYYKLNHSYIFLNTAPERSSQIISNIYYKNINPNLILSTQINYTPILIALNQSEALQKVIIANSIINYPKELADINQLLNSDIKFNWVNYSASILCNRIYNQNYYLNDFYLYMFNNQIEYKTNLYQIIFRGFKKIN